MIYIQISVNIIIYSPSDYLLHTEENSNNRAAVKLFTNTLMDDSE